MLFKLYIQFGFVGTEITVKGLTSGVYWWMGGRDVVDQFDFSVCSEAANITNKKFHKVDTGRDSMLVC